MAADRFEKVLPLILAHEGGYVNHPADPGGATMKGVTQAVYDSYRRNKGLAVRSVRQITTTELRAIYKFQYWDMINGDRLPAGLDYAAFDYAVNSGASRASKDLQRVLGVKVDGQIGEGTIEKACELAGVDEEGLIRDFCDRRMRFLKNLKTYGTFGRGWFRRVMGDRDGFQEGDHGVIDLAIMMARDDMAFPITKDLLPTAIGEKEGEVNGKAEEKETAVTKTTAGIGSIITATGATGQTVFTAAEQVKPHIDDTPFGKIAFLVFIVMMLAGAGLLGYTFYTRMKEKGAI